MQSGPVEMVEADDPARAARGGIVLISEIHGVEPSLREHADRLARLGFTVAMPDLWWRQGKPDLSSPEAIAAGVEALADSAALADVRSALGALPAGLPRFVMGFCIGGLYARMAACTLPGLSGAIEFYGRVIYPGTTPNKPVQPLDLLVGLSCPLQCHFGTEDLVAPPRHVDMLEQRLAGRPFPGQVYRYAGCGHRFMNPRATTFNRVAAELAWSRVKRFLDERVE